MTRRLAAAAVCSTLTMLTALLLPVSSAGAAAPSEDRWLADVNLAMAGSRIYAGDRVSEGGTMLAVNLDIDNTSLASHYDYGQAVGVVLRFARYADAHGVTLLFNTGRLRGEGRQVEAARQLRRAGYPVTEVCGRSGPAESLAHSKQRCRRHFVRRGYTLIANVGNRATDFVGGDYERAFRLPSYGNALS